MLLLCHNPLFFLFQISIVGMNFKSAIPNEFVQFIREAQEWRERGNSSVEELSLAPAALAILEVVSLHTSMRLYCHST